MRSCAEYAVDKLPHPSCALVMEFHLHKLEEAFERRKTQNASYSLRAYARDLGVHPSTLSKVLKGQRGLPFSSLDRVTGVLALSEGDKSKFCSSVLRNRGLGLPKDFDWVTEQGQALKNDKHFRIISEWEYFAFLNLLKIKNFQSDAGWVARRLGSSEVRVQKMIKDLLEAGMIEVSEKGQWQRTHSRLRTSDEVNSLALRVGHQNDLRLAASRLWEVPIEERDFCSMVMPSRPETLKKAKKLVREFLKQMEELMEGEDATEVYQVAVQVFPMTKKNSVQRGKK